MSKAVSYVAWALLLCLSMLATEHCCMARGQSGAAGEQIAPQAVPAAAVDDEPEEPDFAFIAGGPYTQKKQSIQFIFPGQWGRRRSSLGGSALSHVELGTLLRTEWGLTDRWELDFIFAADGERNRLEGTTVGSDFALSDTVLGARYRLLDESFAPLTLAMGPQIIIPTGNLLRGTGFEKTGYAWDLAAAKDWGGSIFLYSSLNYSFFPSVNGAGGAKGRAFNLQNVFWATALGLRPFERPHGTSHHDIHLFLEYGLGREEGLESRAAGLAKVSSVQSLFAPGIRYGILTRTKKLFEIGVSLPRGLSQDIPRGGIILQIQFERFLGIGTD
ncbi:MAG TPA: hypothetical protein VM182_03970 [Terriglobia bacterium]|nr:hypothetical protein [Terriglobia bacterium]